MQKVTTIVLSLALLLGLAAGLVGAGSSAHYAIERQVLSGGGAPAAGGNGVSLNGSFGQTIIGPASDGQVSLQAGYWYVVSGAQVNLYLPLLCKDD